MYDGPERRKYPRLPTTYIARYRLRHTKSNHEVNQTQNISQKGALLITNRLFRKIDQLELLIQFPFANDAVPIIGEVVTCEELIQGISYRCGVKFIEMDDEMNKKLGEIIERRRHMSQT